MLDLSDNMYIVYASDDNFAEFLGVSILSLFENQKHIKNITVYIIDNNIGKKNKSYIECVCENYKRHLPVWLEAKNINDVLNIKVENDRGSTAQYARLFISGLLPEKIDRVLYLDCDIIINQSIDELWNLEMQNNTIAALMDAFSKQYRANIELDKHDIMFNSGVMLIDMKRWRKLHIEKKLMNFITAHRGIIQQGDQGALNNVLNHDVYCIEPRFNSVSIFYDFNYKDMILYRRPPEFYKEEEIKLAIQSPVIIHYTTSFLSKRPWIEGSEHKYKGIWLAYKAKSPWANEPLRTYQESKLKKYYIILYKLLPRWIALRISSLLQVYGRPMLYRVRSKKK